jgi:multidrug efflux system outer membrane protein
MRALAFAFTAAAAGVLTACAVGPDYQRPTIESPATYAGLPANAAPAAADAEWWKQFGDPVLESLIGEALGNSKDLRIAAARVEQAAAVLVQTRSPLFPQINYQAQPGRYRYSEQSTTATPIGLSNPTSYTSVLAGASWELDLWGRIRRQSEAAQATLLATEAARRGVVLSLVTQLATSYVQLRSLDEQLVIAERTRAAYRDSLKLTLDKFEFGQVSRIQVAQVQSQLETASARIPQIRTQIKQTETAITLLVGRNPGPVPRGKSITELTPPLVPAGVPSQLLERRPDILQAEQQLIAANAQIGAAKALYFPTISLTGAFGSSSTELGNLFSGPTRVWSYAGSLAGPLFAGGAISAQVTSAEAGQRAALATYERAIQHAFADVDQALAARADVDEQLAAQDRLVKSLAEYSELSRMLFDGGYMPYSTVLQAEQQLFPEELNLAAARGQALVAVVALYRTMGGGWVEQATQRAPAVRDGALFAPKVSLGTDASAKPVEPAR